MVMANASKNPAKFAKEEEDKKTAMAGKTDRERQDERAKLHEQRKKDRITKLKMNNEMNDELKGAIDPSYKQATQAIENTAK